MRHPELDDAPLRSRYGLEGKLGRGGMGVVAEAQDRRVGRKVAIKRLAGPPTAEMVERFVREARVQGRLDHPAVAPVYDLGIQSDGRPYFAMRKLEGITLAELLHRIAHGDGEAIAVFPRRRLLEALVAVCLAIEYAHTQGVIHRDLKPANVVLGEHGGVHVIDWGVARVAGDPGPRFDGGAGTLGYMAPEQARDDAELDARVDVYALGCLLFEILAGAPYHEGPAGRAPGHDAPPELELICSRALATNRDDRFPTARALAEALQRHLDADHDIDVQRDQAARHAARANEALAQVGPPGDDVARATAIREAGLALALDPANTEAAAVVRALLVEAPEHPPVDVVRAVEAADADTVRVQAKTSAIAYSTQAAFVPVFLMQGIKDWTFLAWLCALIVTLTMTAIAAWRGHLLRVWTWMSVIGNTAMAICLSRVLGPFVIPPGVAVIVAMAVMTDPGVRVWWLVPACLGLAPILALVLEETGVIATTMHGYGDHLELGSSAVHLPAELVAAGLVGYVLALSAVAVLFARGVAAVHHENRRRLAVQAWHLQRLLPEQHRQRPELFFVGGTARSFKKRTVSYRAPDQARGAQTCRKIRSSERGAQGQPRPMLFGPDIGSRHA